MIGSRVARLGSIACHVRTVADRAPDGTPLYAPRGELVIDAGGERVLCHLCGRAYRDLATSHVYRAHGIDPTAYRVLAGLTPRHPLQSPARSADQAALMRVRIASEPRIGEGMADGARLARSGELQRRAQRAYRERPPALERQRQLSADGSRLGNRPGASVQGTPQGACARARLR